MVEYIHMWGNKVNLFDEHLAQNFAYISATEGADLRTVFNDTLVQAAPRSAVTFVVNHKTPPIVDLVMKPWFKLLAYALILLREGGCKYSTSPRAAFPTHQLHHHPQKIPRHGA